MANIKNCHLSTRRKTNDKEECFEEEKKQVQGPQKTVTFFE